MYRVVLESLLGFEIVGGDTLRLAPCVPDEWPEFRLDWRVPGGETRYEIVCRNPRRRAQEVVEAALDGKPVPVADGAARLPIVRDGRTHRVEIVLGRRSDGGTRRWSGARPHAAEGSLP
jgi:cyclic beta-1,2-glucan synthetase